jgi:GT2 family glycosyltransferase
VSVLRAGIVVVHWQGMDDTHACLASLSTIVYPAVDAVVVVNGPGDFDDEWAGEAAPLVEAVVSERNLGYGGGCNLGARMLLDRGADFVLFLNNDTVVSPDILDDIAEVFAAEPEIGVAGPVVVYYDDPGRVWFAGGTLNRTFGYTRHRGFRARDLPRTGAVCDFISGSAIAVRREVLERTGGFDEAYFHYFEDTELCARASVLGFASYVVPAASVRHRVSASAGEPGSNRLNRRQAYYFARNRWRFVRRNFAGWRRIAALWSQIFLLLPYECVKAAFSRNWEELRGRIDGLADGILGRTGPRA